MGKIAMVCRKKNTAHTQTGESQLEHKPFGKLQDLIDHYHPCPLEKTCSDRSKKADFDTSDEQLFSEAMTGVSRLDSDRTTCTPPPLPLSEDPAFVPEDDALSSLERLIDCGDGFVVADTPEYMEGVGYNVRKDIAGCLHRGDFSISDHIDLHGMTVPVAREAFESFLKSSYLAGKGAVLVIHGRGLSSQGDAVLKNNVREWLGQSYWQKRVIAYASAQSYDGGAGATYVLLRSRPVSKKRGGDNDSV